MPFTRRVSKRAATLMTAVVVGLGLCAIVLIFAQPWGGTTSAVVSSNSNRITRIELDAGIEPATVTEGDLTQVHFQIMIRGGPGPVMVGGRFPKKGGGYYDLSFTLMLDRDAVYGFDVPFEAHITPGEHLLVLKAASFHNPRVRAGKNVRLVVRPMFPW